MAEYVYGIVATGTEAPDVGGVAGASVRSIESDGLAALVSELPGDELVLGREEMLVHSHVLEAALEHGTVLPTRFGVVMDDADDVKGRLLEAHAAELHGQLQELAGKVELSIRAIYEEKTMLTEVVHENREIARLRQALRDLPADATYYERIRLGELVAGAVEEKRARDAARLLDAVEPAVVAVRTSESGHERVALSASFLVERRRLGEFDELLERYAASQSGRIRVKYTGPLPPHSFVELAGVA